MMIRRAILLAATGAALSTAAPASAAPICNATTLGEHSATVCVNTGGSGTVIDATGSASVCLDWSFGCQEIGLVTLGPTGAEPGSVPPVNVDPRAGAISSPGGTIATVYANGTALAVNAPSFCVGPPGFCPGGGLPDIGA